MIAIHRPRPTASPEAALARPTLARLALARLALARRPGVLGALSLLIAALLLGCVDDTAGASAQPKPAKAAGAIGGGDQLLIVGTDYASTSLAWVDPATLTIAQPGFLHSGSAVSAAGAALSGDVVPGSEGLPDGRFPVLDRSQSSLTWVGGEALSQWPVSDGFQANPQDVWRYDGDVVVVRAQPDPTPTDALLSGGDDVLILSPTGTPKRRIPLADESTLPGGMAFPGRGVRLGARLWLPLASFRRDFSGQGAGRVVEVDLSAGVVARRVAVPEVQNCTTLRPERSEPGATNLVGTCSGFFQATAAEQLAGSGVIRVDTAAGTASVLLHATAIGGPLGFPIAADGGKRGWVVRLGQLSAPARPDEVWMYDGEGGPPTRVWRAQRAFSLGGLWYDSARKRLWITDASDKAGDLVVLDVSTNAAMPPVVKRLKSQNRGLAAVHLALRRAP